MAEVERIVEADGMLSYSLINLKVMRSTTRKPDWYVHHDIGEPMLTFLSL